MKAQEVILRVLNKQIAFWEAARKLRAQSSLLASSPLAHSTITESLQPRNCTVITFSGLDLT
jgi:hypothetical protein